MNVTLLKWSRFLHKWLGVYIAVFTILWLFELILLPSFYSVGVPVASTEQQTQPLSIQQVVDNIDAGKYGACEQLELRYHSAKNQYVLVNNSTFSHLTLDAQTGHVVSNKLDYDTLLMKKSGLGWLNEALGDYLKIPFQIFFVILSITGIHLLSLPYLKKRKKSAAGLLSLRPGQQFIFKATTSPDDMAKTASIGLLPGVRVTLLYKPRRGPVVLSARNTRIAVARSVTKSFIIEPVEI